MKNINIIIGVMFVSFFVSCEADFLDRNPKTEITAKDFFNTVEDLRTYSNGFYKEFKAVYDDQGSDNVSISTGTNTIDQLVIGNITSSNVKGWDKDDWEKLRSINYFLEHSSKAEGIKEDLDHYIGIGRFFRARFYYDKIKTYSDVPWYSIAMETEDTNMYKPCDSRVLIVDSILKDIEFAVDHIKPELKSKTRINKYTALAFMARVCLYEGTFRKYHSELNLYETHSTFLEKAVWASEQIMNSGEFEITGNGGAGYGALFHSSKLDENKEIILQLASDKELGVANNSHSVLNWQWSLSRSLMESFLMKDGTPFTDIPDYDKKTFIEVFKDRDPRLTETISYPGFKVSETSSPELPGIKFGGYGQIKFYPKDPAQRGGWDLNYTSLPVFRYGEILLIYAEAKAELGSLNQGDLDKTINLLRNRVNMPNLSMNSKTDSKLASYYSNASGSNLGVLLEIRRERRVELSCEGLRAEDLKRWAAGEHFADNNQGIYIPNLGAYDMTGDGNPDLAILASPDETAPIASLTEEERSKLVFYYLKKKDGTDEGFYLSNGNSGFVEFTAYRKNPRTFITPKYYYLPIPKQQVLLNPKLKQPFGWE